MFSRIHKAVRKLLIFSASVIFFIGLLLLLQTLLGRYSNMPASAWFWFVIHIIPVNAIIFYLFLKNKAVTINVAIRNLFLYQLLFWAAITYMSTLAIVLLIQPFLGNEKTAIQNLRSTDVPLYVFQIILAGLAIYFGSKISRFNKMQRSAFENEETDPATAGVFISYNHGNSAEAQKIKDLLQKEGIDVIIDSEKMDAGENINSFIERSVKDSMITLSIISKESLLSGWVASETINTFFLEKFNKNKRFIACYIDENFLDRRFSSEAAKVIDEKLEILRKQLDENAELDIDTRDLNAEITRLRTLKANIDLILERLRNSLCIDIRNENLIKNFPLLLKSIKKTFDSTTETGI